MREEKLGRRGRACSRHRRFEAGVAAQRTRETGPKRQTHEDANHAHVHRFISRSAPRRGRAHEATNHVHVHRFLPLPAPRRGRVENDEDAACYARERDDEGGKSGETWPRTQPTPPLRGGSRRAAHERDGRRTHEATNHAHVHRFLPRSVADRKKETKKKKKKERIQF